MKNTIFKLIYIIVFILSIKNCSSKLNNFINKIEKQDAYYLAKSVSQDMNEKIMKMNTPRIQIIPNRNDPIHLSKLSNLQMNNLNHISTGIKDRKLVSMNKRLLYEMRQIKVFNTLKHPNESVNNFKNYINYGKLDSLIALKRRKVIEKLNKLKRINCNCLSKPKCPCSQKDKVDVVNISQLTHGMNKKDISKINLINSNDDNSSIPLLNIRTEIYDKERNCDDLKNKGAIITKVEGEVIDQLEKMKISNSSKIDIKNKNNITAGEIMNAGFDLAKFEKLIVK